MYGNVLKNTQTQSYKKNKQTHIQSLQYMERYKNKINPEKKEKEKIHILQIVTQLSMS